MPVNILGIGTAVPRHRISQQEAAQAAVLLARCTPEQGNVVAALYRHTEIAGRHMVIGRDVLGDVLNGTCKSGSRFVPDGPDDSGPNTADRMRIYEREALPMALEASTRALEESECVAAEITHLVTVSCTGFAAPGFDVGLIKQLQLPPTVERTHIGFMGCHGALNGLRLARAFIEADSRARVLLCATELCSIHYHYSWNPKRMVGNALFADGAAALVAASEKDDDGSNWRIEANASCLFPNCENALTWSIGNRGFDMTLSTRVPSLIAAYLRSWVVRWLAECGLTMDAIGSWAIHPGGPRILTTVEESLGLSIGSTSASREVFAQFGNMSSPTVLFIVDRLRKLGAPRPCVALGFGPGMTVEGALFD
ncbi:MAG: type III polyketide synthase [Planctomycetes bacterium]|nr:type III polyketide synthase [Planctomycetota bacterium]